MIKHSRESLTPFDVRSVESTRFPQPVSRSRWADRLTFGLLCALGGASLMMVLLGLLINFAAP